MLLGGTLNDIDEDSTAFSRAGAEWLFEAIGMWEQAAPDDDYTA